MMYDTLAGVQVNRELVSNYFKSLVNHFFKILPIRENEEGSLGTYMRSLQIELIGCRDFLPAIHDNSDFMKLLSILQYLIDHPECEVKEVKREVFQAISVCNRLVTTFNRDGGECK